MKAVVAAFNQEKALVGALSVITNLRMELFEALVRTPNSFVLDICSRNWILDMSPFPLQGQEEWQLQFQDLIVDICLILSIFIVSCHVLLKLITNTHTSTCQAAHLSIESPSLRHFKYKIQWESLNWEEESGRQAAEWRGMRVSVPPCRVWAKDCFQH